MTWYTPGPGRKATMTDENIQDLIHTIDRRGTWPSYQVAHREGLICDHARYFQIIRAMESAGLLATDRPHKRVHGLRKSAPDRYRTGRVHALKGIKKPRLPAEPKSPWEPPWAALWPRPLTPGQTSSVESCKLYRAAWRHLRRVTG